MAVDVDVDVAMAVDVGVVADVAVDAQVRHARPKLELNEPHDARPPLIAGITPPPTPNAH